MLHLLVSFLAISVIPCSDGAKPIKRCYAYENGTRFMQDCPDPKNTVACAGMIFNGKAFGLFPDPTDACVSKADFTDHPVYKKVGIKQVVYCFCGIETWWLNTTYCWCWCNKGRCNHENRLKKLSSQCVARFREKMKNPENKSASKKSICDVGYAAEKGKVDFHKIY